MEPDEQHMARLTRMAMLSRFYRMSWQDALAMEEPLAQELFDGACAALRLEAELTNVVAFEALQGETDGVMQGVRADIASAMDGDE